MAKRTEEIVIWHNPRCSKSRQGLAFLKEHGVEPTVVRYLDSPPDVETLTRVLDMLGMAPRDLVRRREAIYRELGLKDPTLSDEALIKAMVDNPKLIERPVVIRGNEAVLGRPASTIAELLRH